MKPFLSNFIFLIFLTVYLAHSSSGTETDSLLEVIKRTSDDTVRMNCYGMLGERTAQADPFKSIEYFKEAIKIGEKLRNSKNQVISGKALKELEMDYNSIGELNARTGNYKDAIKNMNKAMYISRKINNNEGLAYNMNSLGLIFFRTGNLNMAERFYSASLKRFKTVGSKRGIALVSNNLGRFLYMQGRSDESEKMLKNSLKLCKDIDDREIMGMALSNLGVLSNRKGKIEDALKYYSEWLSLEEEAGNKMGLAYALTNIGGMLCDQRRWNDALTYCERALSLHTEIGNIAGQAYIYNNIGGIFFNLRRDSAAFENYSRAIGLWEKLGEKRELGMSLEGLALAHEKLGSRQKTLEILLKAKYLYIETNDKIGLASVSNNIASLYLSMKKYNEAVGNAKNSLRLSRELNYPENIKDAALTLSKIYEEQNMIHEALEYYKLYKQFGDSILNQTTVKQITEMQGKYESEKKEKEILLLRKDRQIQMAEATRQRIIRNSFIAAAFLSLILAIVLFNRYKIKQRANKQLKEHNEQIRLQKDLIAQQKQDMTDSIEYAGNIQRAVLPSLEEFKSLFPDSFILYKPRDIVSGDFYWIAKIENGNPDRYRESVGENEMKENVSFSLRPSFSSSVLLCVADCTGHGVPGAFMSMLCNALLNETVTDNRITDPDKIFDEVRNGIITALKQKGRIGENKDGMDAILLRIFTSPEDGPDPGARMEVSSANNPVYLVRNGILSEYKPDRFPVGFYEGEIKPFSLNKMLLSKGDMLYLFTDGYEDQLGGEKQKKFKSSRLKELLISISGKPLDTQNNILEKTLLEWRGSGEQTDDVTAIGIRI
ncbi:MAG: tetratricopeptide repeat protein [Bacteroidetes bacterium]|nr:tetratricopeptide repeat protein [Bacteroidota bacterium]